LRDQICSGLVESVAGILIDAIDNDNDGHCGLTTNASNSDLVVAILQCQYDKIGGSFWPFLHGTVYVGGRGHCQTSTLQNNGQNGFLVPVASQQ
jgi:hypothetical protein